MNFRKFVSVAFIAIGLLFSTPLLAQQGSSQDLSEIRVDELSDSQVRQFMSQIEALGLTDAQLEQVAQARGMSSEEIRKLRRRVELLKAKEQKTVPSADTLNGKNVIKGGVRDTLTRRDSISLAEQALSQLRSKIFGADLFRTSGLTFEPNLRLATPRNYVIGPDDQLLIDIYGYSEASYKLTVNPEGTINIPYIGVVSVSGMTIEAATARIKSRLSAIYSGLKTGNTFLSVAVGSIRSIKVVLTGEVVKPGTYSLPSVATVFNALYSSGGPTENGSFREIEVIRAGRKIAKLDVYDFLLTGEFKNNLRLQDEDVIRIPTYRKRVEIVGEVKRPGIFELVNGETLDDLLRFAGDFSERAYQARVKVLKNTATERMISDITSEEFKSYKPSSGDKYFVDEILDRFQNRVTIEGAVFRPGQFELEPGLTIKGLIKKAEGLREDAFQPRGHITRLKDDLQTEIIAFDISKVLSGQAADIPLKREDVIVISSIFDLKEEYTITVQGEVKSPATMAYSEGISLEDAILQAGGLKESATAQRIEVSRRVKNSNALSESAQTAEVFQINVNQDLSLSARSFILQPFDIVTVRPSAGYEVQRQVFIEGEVLYPGQYTIARRDERISDLIKRAGGFTGLAYIEGASLRRVRGQSKTNRDEQLKRLQMGISDSVRLTDDQIENEFVGISLPEILKNPAGKEDLFLEGGDVLSVPKQLQTVSVNGEVLSPVTVMYSKYKGVRGYISNAGGFGVDAKKRKTYVIYANGAVRATRKIFFFFNNYPPVKPGSEIFVPAKAAGRRVSAGEIVGVSTGLASLAAIILSLFK